MPVASVDRGPLSFTHADIGEEDEMRFLTLMFSMLLCTAAHAATQVSIFIGEPRMNIGINVPAYPEFVRVPSYPVYYAPRAHSNIFFYDGLYWVYYDDRWYASTWYNGPWGLVDPVSVPLYVLRVPVRYYRAPPAYFTAWAVDAPPRWDVHWGATWAQERAGWDSWNRSSVPTAAPLPVYQRQYTGTRYPSVDQQHVLQSQQYRYQPRDTVVKQYYTNVVRTSATSQTASSHAPGQVKKQEGAQSAKEFAPGHVKKQQNAQSAKEFAPGQVKKQQTAQGPPTVLPAQPVHAEKGHGNRDRDDDDNADHGEGHGKGKGKGHGKD